jgi:hypothetical protein
MLFVAVYVPPRFAISPDTFTSDFANAGLFFLGDIVAITLGVFFNNLSDTSQYPMYWNLTP